MKKLLTSAMLMLLPLAGLRAAHVTSWSAPSISGSPKEAKYTDYLTTTGKITAIDNNSISIQNADGTVSQYELANDAVILRDRHEGQVSDLRAGETVKLNYLRDGRVATSVLYDSNSAAANQ